jgi:hypothetical protein
MDHIKKLDTIGGPPLIYGQQNAGKSTKDKTGQDTEKGY